MEDSKTTDLPIPSSNTLLEKTPLQETKYFKMRSLVSDIRPHLLEVMRTPDFRNSKASAEVLEKIKNLLEIYHQMSSEKLSITQPLHSDAKPADIVTEKEKPEQSPPQPAQQPDGSIVGGSAFGWNFVTFITGTEPIYYGVTKDSFRASQKVVQEIQDQNQDQPDL